MTPNTASEANSDTTGASRYSGRLMPCGSRLSLRISLIRSAIGCRRPNGPTRLGPSRFWRRPSSRRSAQVSIANTPNKTFASTSDLMSVIQNPSGIDRLHDGGDAPGADVGHAGRQPDDAAREPPRHHGRAGGGAPAVLDRDLVAGGDPEVERVVVGELDA